MIGLRKWDEVLEKSVRSFLLARLVDPEPSALEFGTVEVANRLFTRGSVGKRDKGKTSRLIGVGVDRVKEFLEGS